MLISGRSARHSAAIVTLFAIACGSDPLEPADESDGGRGETGETGGTGTGGTGTGGTGTGADPGGTGGSGGDQDLPNIPDYTTSPCYGQTATTLRYDGKLHQPIEVTATCRGEGERTLVYVGDEVFGTRVTQEGLSRFLYRYELAGSEKSYRPNLGILTTDEEVFGSLPAAQIPAGKLPIFVIDTHGGGDGYLCGWCTRPELHLDALQLSPLDGDVALAIAAHESFHAIHRGYDPNEAVWVDETLAEAAMIVNGFSDPAWLDRFLDKPNVNWGPSIASATDFQYGVGLAYGAYLWEQGGPELMRAITTEPKNDWAGIDAALVATGSSRDGLTMFLDMAVALYLDDPARGYGFESLDFGTKLQVTSMASSGATKGTVQAYGLVYLEVPPGVTSLTVEGATTVRARLIIDRDPLDVQTLDLDAAAAIDSAPTVLILTATGTAQYTVTPG